VNPQAQPGGWPSNTNNLFGEQNQQPMPSQPLQPNVFGSPNTSGFSGPSSSSFNNSFSTFQQNPNSSSVNNAFFTAANQKGFAGTSPWSSANNPARPAWMKGQNEDNAERGSQKRSKGMVVAVVITLVVLLLGGGSFGIYKFLKAQNSTSNTTQSAPTIVTPTGTPLFSDTFQSNSANWNLTQPTGAKITLAGGKMVLESDNNKLFQEPLPGAKSFSDLRLDVDAGLTSGDAANGYGVYIRGASTQNSPLGLYYRFEVYGDGSFVIYKGFQDASGNLQYTSLKQSPANNAIGQKGQMNHLTIIAKGTELKFVVNSTTVADFTDTTYKSGTVALFVSNVAKVAAGAQATFQRLAIFPAQ
jgi:hypothetical protein